MHSFWWQIQCCCFCLVLFFLSRIFVDMVAVIVLLYIHFWALPYLLYALIEICVVVLFLCHLPFGQMMWWMHKITITNAISTVKWFSRIITQRTLHLATTPMATIFIIFSCDMKIFWCTKAFIVGMISHYIRNRWKQMVFIIYLALEQCKFMWIGWMICLYALNATPKATLRTQIFFKRYCLVRTWRKYIYWWTIKKIQHTQLFHVMQRRLMSFNKNHPYVKIMYVVDFEILYAQIFWKGHLYSLPLSHEIPNILLIVKYSFFSLSRNNLLSNYIHGR